MITVTIFVNGNPIITRSAINRIEETGAYICDEGTLITHDPDDGAVVLAQKMLDTAKAFDDIK